MKKMQGITLMVVLCLSVVLSCTAQKHVINQPVTSESKAVIYNPTDAEPATPSNASKTDTVTDEESDAMLVIPDGEVGEELPPINIEKTAGTSQSSEPVYMNEQAEEEVAEEDTNQPATVSVKKPYAELPEFGTKIPYIVDLGFTIEKLKKTIFGEKFNQHNIYQSDGSVCKGIAVGDVVYYELNQNSIKFAHYYHSRKPLTYTIKPGNTLTQIAQDVYGHAAAWKVIWRSSQIKNPDKIYVGQRITYYANELVAESDIKNDPSLSGSVVPVAHIPQSVKKLAKPTLSNQAPTKNPIHTLNLGKNSAYMDIIEPEELDDLCSNTEIYDEIIHEAMLSDITNDSLMNLSHSDSPPPLE